MTTFARAGLWQRTNLSHLAPAHGNLALNNIARSTSSAFPVGSKQAVTPQELPKRTSTIKPAPFPAHNRGKKNGRHKAADGPSMQAPRAHIIPEIQRNLRRFNNHCIKPPPCKVALRLQSQRSCFKVEGRSPSPSPPPPLAHTR